MAEPAIQPAAEVKASDPEVSDAELLRRVALSSPGSQSRESMRALESLFRRHSEALLRFLTRTLRSETNAEDILHDVFVRVTEAAGTFRSESSVRTWLFTLALNQVRSRQRRSALESRATMKLLTRPNAADTRQDPFEQAQQRELCERVDAAIAELNEAERETFLLYWFGKMTYAEISAASGVSVSAAKVRVHRALARLTAMLKDPE